MAISFTFPRDKTKINNTLAQIDNNIKDIYNSLPPNSLFIISSLHGDLVLFEQLKKLGDEKSDEKTEMKQNVVEAARQGISLFAIKK